MNSASPFRDGLVERLRRGLERTMPFASREHRIVLGLLLLVLIGPLVSHLYKSLYRQRGDWFSIYAIADHSVRTGELWADPDEAVVRTQRYPPITRPLLMLLAWPPKPVSAVLSFALFTALYLGCAASLSRWFLPPSQKAAPGRILGIAVLWAVVLPYLFADLVACNLTSVLLASVTGAYALASRGKPLRAGVVLSIGVMLKMIPLLCLLHFLVRRQWRVGWGVLIGVVVLGVAPSLAIFEPQKLWNYHGWWYRTQFAEFTPMHTIDDPVECTYQNQAVVRTLVRLLTHTNAGHAADPFYLTLAEPPRWAIKLIYVGVMGASLAGLLALLWRRRGDDSPIGAATSHALCVGAMLWFSPWVGSYYFSLTMWPAAALLAAVLRDSTGGRVARMTLLIWMLAMPALASLRLRAYGLTMGGLLLLLCGVAWLMLRADRPAPNRPTGPM